MLRNSGARIGGLLAATVQGTDVEGGVITTIEKGGRKKRLYLKEAAREPLRRWLAIRSQLDPKDDKLFLGQSGYGLSRSGAEKIWDRLAEAAGVEDQRHNFHIFSACVCARFDSGRRRPQPCFADDGAFIDGDNQRLLSTVYP